MGGKMPEKQTRGLPLAIREEYFNEIWGQHCGIEETTLLQQQCLRYYYGLKTAALSTGKIQRIIGARNHSYVRGICVQGERALDVLKRQRVLRELGQPETAKDIAPYAREEYLKAMYKNFSLKGVSREDARIFKRYYGTEGNEFESVGELAKELGERESKIFKRIADVERVVSKNNKEAIANRITKQWSKKVGRFCPRCGSTNIYLKGVDESLNSEIRCKDCSYMGGVKVQKIKLILRLAS
jgi:predicted RNA-binding Zn-ribbon protein involved in translation (DUF1610 family)